MSAKQALLQARCVSMLTSFQLSSHAYFSLGRYSEAAKAYEKAVELDPGNASLKSSLSTARSRASESEDGQTSRDVGASSPPPAGGANPFAGLAGLAGLGGGAGGAGGMPDIASLLQNPQLMQMAQQMMGVSYNGFRHSSQADEPSFSP